MGEASGRRLGKEAEGESFWGVFGFSLAERSGGVRLFWTEEWRM